MLYHNKISTARNQSSERFHPFKPERSYMRSGVDGRHLWVFPVFESPAFSMSFLLFIPLLSYECHANLTTPFISVNSLDRLHQCAITEDHSSTEQSGRTVVQD